VLGCVGWAGRGNLGDDGVDLVHSPAQADQRSGRRDLIAAHAHSLGQRAVAHAGPPSPVAIGVGVFIVLNEVGVVQLRAGQDESKVAAVRVESGFFVEEMVGELPLLGRGEFAAGPLGEQGAAQERYAPGPRSASSAPASTSFVSYEHDIRYG
jgi:hypothetical protein